MLCKSAMMDEKGMRDERDIKDYEKSTEHY
jgi:hypothetical protein